MSTQDDGDDYAMRRWVAAVFNSDKPRRSTADESDPLPNHVAMEGSNSSNVRSSYVGRDALRNWVGDLFGTDPNSRGLNSGPW